MREAAAHKDQHADDHQPGTPVQRMKREEGDKGAQPELKYLEAEKMGLVQPGASRVDARQRVHGKMYPTECKGNGNGKGKRASHSHQEVPDPPASPPGIDEFLKSYVLYELLNKKGQVGKDLTVKEQLPGPF